MARFDHSQLRFEYPDAWSLVAHEEEPERASATVAGAGTAFCTVSLVDSAVHPEEAVEAAVDAYRQEYKTVDVYPAAGGYGRDVEFFSLELCNTAWLRAYHAPAGTIVLLFQCTDTEVAEERRHFELIHASLERIAER